MQSISKTEESPQKPIWESLLERASIKKEELQKKIEEKKQKDDLPDPECSFQPTLIAQYQSTQNELSFVERQKKWLEDKNQKINEKKNSTQDKSLEECSFQPELGPQPAIVAEIDFKNTKGLDTFIQRQEKARKIKQEKQFLLSNPYSHLSSEKKAIKTNEQKKVATHPISKEYESIKKAERIEFSKAVDITQDLDQSSHQQKMQLGVAMKMLHNQLYNIKFNSEF